MAFIKQITLWAAMLSVLLLCLHSIPVYSATIQVPGTIPGSDSPSTHEMFSTVNPLAYPTSSMSEIVNNAPQDTQTSASTPSPTVKPTTASSSTKTPGTGKQDPSPEETPPVETTTSPLTEASSTPEETPPVETTTQPPTEASSTGEGETTQKATTTEIPTSVVTPQPVTEASSTDKGETTKNVPTGEITSDKVGDKKISPEKTDSFSPIPGNKSITISPGEDLLTTGGAESTTVDENQQAVKAFLDKYDKDIGVLKHASEVAAYRMRTNITDENSQKQTEATLLVAKFRREMAHKAEQFEDYKLLNDQERMLRKIKDIGPAAQTNVTKYKQLQEVMAEMESIYGTAKVCEKDKCLALEPDLTRIMAKSHNHNELLDAWKGWRDATGPKMKQLYSQYVDLKNDAVKEGGHPDAGEDWRSTYETPTFEEDVRTLFDQIRPLYEHLHAYVRRRLKTIYDDDKFPKSGHIPAHLLGNMWAQHFDIYESVVPFKTNSTMDVTSEMLKQNYTAEKIFRTAEHFFLSIGLDKMVDSFWNKSMLTKPEDGREVVCHASAWDFYDGKDFRIKMCTDITHYDLMTAHHEMGHIEYYMQYRDQPQIYREGANAGFHEAVGDVMALSVQTPEHMTAIGLMKADEGMNDTETDLNFLMNMALQKVAFLPFGYLIDQWRWSVFRGDIKPEKYNEGWWDLRCRYQGISSPIPRGPDDFDPGAKYHVAADVPYIRYFVSYIIQFQFHKAACEAAGNTKALHRCDIYNSKEAGTKIKNMLKLGSSKPWQDAMEQLTGQRKMDASAIMEYFAPLLEFLRKENKNDYGWDPKCPEFEKPVKHSKEKTTEKPKNRAEKFSLSLTSVFMLFLFRTIVA